MTLRPYYILLLPDDTLLVRSEYNLVTSDERSARECWKVDAHTKEDALGKVVGHLYTQVVQLSAELKDERCKPNPTTYAPNYRDPNAQTLHDTVERAMKGEHTVETCQERSLGL